MTLPAELLLTILGQLAAAAGIYAAIRADLREALIRSHMAQEAAQEAHRRLDELKRRGH